MEIDVKIVFDKFMVNNKTKIIDFYSEIVINKNRNPKILSILHQNKTY